MKFLIDTHVFLWWVMDSTSFSAEARRLLTDDGSSIVLSSVVPWELAIKSAKGQLVFAEPLDTVVDKYTRRFGLDPLPVSIPHALKTATLPGIHRDPFDRMLIAQALVENLPLMTADAIIARYKVPIIW